MSDLLDTKPQRAVYKRPYLYPKQERALFAPVRYSLIEASTKSGKTVGALVWLIEQAIQGKRGQAYWWVAPVYRQANIAFRRAETMIPERLRSVNKSEQYITLANGAVVWFLSAEKPDHLYGDDVYAAVIDEASRVREESRDAVRSTLTATQGPMRIIGNVKGKGTWFYRMCRLAESNEANMEYHKIDVYDAIDAGIFPAEEMEDARRQLPDHVFRELYLAEAVDDDTNPFGIQAIADCVQLKETKAPIKAWGWDVAKSQDWTVGTAMDGDRGVARWHRFRQPWVDTVARMQRECKGIETLVDSTGVGDPVLEMLQGKIVDGKRRSTTLYRNFKGFKFTGQSKQQLIEALIIEVQNGDIGILDGVARREFEMFEYQYTRTGVRYAAPEGTHDDCVMSAALALWAYRNRRPKPRAASRR